jgi:hypothetical protein
MTSKKGSGSGRPPPPAKQGRSPTVPPDAMKRPLVRPMGAVKPPPRLRPLGPRAPMPPTRISRQERPQQAEPDPPTMRGAASRNLQPIEEPEDDKTSVMDRPLFDEAYPPPTRPHRPEMDFAQPVAESGENTMVMSEAPMRPRDGRRDYHPPSVPPLEALVPRTHTQPPNRLAPIPHPQATAPLPTYDETLALQRGDMGHSPPPPAAFRPRPQSYMQQQAPVFPEPRQPPAGAPGWPTRSQPPPSGAPGWPSRPPSMAPGAYPAPQASPFAAHAPPPNVRSHPPPAHVEPVSRAPMQRAPAPTVPPLPMPSPTARPLEGKTLKPGFVGLLFFAAPLAFATAAIAALALL